MSEGQVSETSMMTPSGGEGSTPGTDDGIPPAAETGHVAEGRPKDYAKTDETNAQGIADNGDRDGRAV